jgi:hypothetical protein
MMPTTEMMRQRLRDLGWRLLDDAQQAPDGSWWLIAESCGHDIIALADTQLEVWSRACAMAMKLTREGYGRSEFVP